MFILLISNLSITVPGCKSSGDSDGSSSSGSSAGGSSSWVGRCIVNGDNNYSNITYYNIDYSENCTQNGEGTWSTDVSDTSCAGTNMACQRTSSVLNFKYCQC